MSYTKGTSKGREAKKGRMSDLQGSENYFKEKRLEFKLRLKMGGGALEEGGLLSHSKKWLKNLVWLT